MYTGSLIVTLGPPLCERPIHGYRGKAMAKNGDGELAFFICLAIFRFKNFALNSRISPYHIAVNSINSSKMMCFAPIVKVYACFGDIRESR